MDKGKNVTIILDTSHHAMRYIHIAKNEETQEEGFQDFKYKFLNGIFEYIHKFNADEVILAIDSKNNWRKEVFKFYKADRKIKRKFSEEKEDGWFKFSEFYNMFSIFIQDIKNNLPFKIIEVDYAEADDIAAVLTSCEDLKQNIKIVITTDNDYIQLIQNQLTRIYNPIKKKFENSNEPKKELFLKVVLGDKGDYVPSIQDRHNYKTEFLEYCVNEGIAKNQHNAKIKLENDEYLCLTNELKFQDKYGIKASRVSTFSKKLANSLIKEGKLMEYLKENPSLKTKFIRNNKLINLTAQPQKLKEDIISYYKNYEMKVGINKLFHFFVTNGFNHFMDNTCRIGELLEPLTFHQV
jgi:hypothetical protein